MNEGEHMSKFAMTAVAVCVVSTALCQNARAQEESYSAILATSNAQAQQIRFNFTVTKWATQDEIKQLGQVLKDQGQDALLAELRKLDAGRINKVGDTGNQIAVAEKSTAGDKNVITVITARKIDVANQLARTTNRNYPFAFLQVMVDDKGEGTGKMVTAAKIKYDNSKGHAVLDPYGNGAVTVTNVKPLK
jgi:methionyl-tRNA formyltransferase